MKNDTACNILFCGTGGQGVLAAAEICGWAALFAGYHVKKSEVHGMAQRGGSVESHLRFGNAVHSPLIPAGRVDYLVPFHKDEEARLRRFCSAKAVNLIGSLDRARGAVERRYVNSYLLGALSRELPIAGECWVRAIEHVLKNKSTQENVQAFLKGRGAP